MRQFLKNFVKKPIKVAFKKLAKANKSNAAKAAIAKYYIVSLKEALKQEKKKRRRGKKLNLFREELGKVQFFGTVKVIRAQACEDAKEAQVAQVKLDKKKQKEEKLVAKVIKEALAKQERIRIVEQKEINC